MIYYSTAVVSFYGLPPKGTRHISDIPVHIPLQAHFGELDSLKSFSDVASARKMHEKWMDNIKRHGGFHALGYHTLDEHTFFYANAGHGFMDLLPSSIDRNEKHGYIGVQDKETVNVAWKRLFEFLSFHLKSV
jgi:dienelactone hydrolase